MIIRVKIKIYIYIYNTGKTKMAYYSLTADSTSVLLLYLHPGVLIYEKNVYVSAKYFGLAYLA